ncbi:Uncharacterised protein [Mycobacteroides abscessus]|nr:Uncharacterised protein [Mycobacteroides abscessus]
MRRSPAARSHWPFACPVTRKVSGTFEPALSRSTDTVRNESPRFAS